MLSRIYFGNYNPLSFLLPSIVHNSPCNQFITRIQFIFLLLRVSCCKFTVTVRKLKFLLFIIIVIIINFVYVSSHQTKIKPGAIKLVSPFTHTRTSLFLKDIRTLGTLFQSCVSHLESEPSIDSRSRCLLLRLMIIKLPVPASMQLIYV